MKQKDICAKEVPSPVTEVLEMVNDRAIAYHPGLGRALHSVQAGILLSQLLYWTARIEEGAWFWKTREQIYAETALTRYGQETARRALRDAGLLEERVAGMPPKIFFKINLEKLATLLTSKSTDCDQPTQSPSGEEIDGSDESEGTHDSIGVESLLILGGETPVRVDGIHPNIGGESILTLGGETPVRVGAFPLSFNKITTEITAGITTEITVVGDNSKTWIKTLKEFPTVQRLKQKSWDRMVFYAEGFEAQHGTKALEAEAEKFRDYWLPRSRDGPKNPVLAWRNWLVIALDIKSQKQGGQRARLRNDPEEYRRAAETF